MSSPLLIEDNNLSSIWCSVLDHIVKNSGYEITPLVVTLSSFNESEVIKRKLNANLANGKFDSIDTVSETIFPNSLYQLVNQNREELYKVYLNNVLPRIKKIDKANGRGTYFERLIAYDDSTDNKKINQLEIIISSLLDKTNNRRSKLQASVFDPTKDHLNGPYQKFPCLQHVTFYKSETGGLVLNSFYAIQYLYQRAYGNWLGLINLGKFIANEADLEFERFNCFIGVEKLDHLKKEQAEKLLIALNS
jgi:thymidylate synthase